MASPETCPCPKCNRTLHQSGTVIVDDVELPVFQCDECLRTLDLFGTGQATQVAFTFCRDASGRLLDPARPDDPLD